MWLLLLPIAHAGCDVPTDGCATLALHRCGAQAWAAPPPAPPSDDKAVRDAFGTFDNQVETANFAVKWGASAAFTRDDVDALADALEAAWAHQVDVLGYPPPRTTDAYKLNVYIGDTGGDAPSSFGAAGYFTWDDDGFPYLVVGAVRVADRALSARTAAHELFHAVQLSSDPYGADGAWWYEATAVWMEAEVHPDDPGARRFVHRLAFRPELPVHFRGGEGFEAYHAYGAFLFARHLSERHGADVIRRTLVGVPEGGTPMTAIDGEVDAEAAFFDFAVRNATFADYPDGPIYRDWIAHYGGWGSPLSHRPTGTVRAGTGWHEADGFLPQTYGAAYWRLDDPPARARVRFEGDASARWHVAVAARGGAEASVWPIDAEIAGLDRYDEVWVVAAAVDGFTLTGQGFGHRVRVDALAEPEDTGGDTADTGSAGAAGCDCDGGRAGWIGWGGALGLLVRRRRR